MPVSHAGWILRPHGFVEGIVTLDEGRVVEVQETATGLAPKERPTILPAPVNAHTHVGDALARGGAIPRDLAAAVAPPDGYKHRVLRSAARADLVAGMRRTVGEMRAEGVRAFADFREGGLPGVAMLREAVAGTDARPVVLARPGGMDAPPDEVEALLEAADGLGLSGIGDVDPAVARGLADPCHRAGKLFALHASEGEREDMDRVLALEPDLLVHLVQATRDDLEQVAEAGVPVVVCPRSNHHLVRALPPVTTMLELGIPVALGTDNAMLHPARLLAEMEFLHEHLPELPRTTIVAMAVQGGRRAVGASSGADPLEPGSPGDLLVLEPRGGDPLDAVFQDPAIVVTVTGVGDPVGPHVGTTGKH